MRVSQSNHRGFRGRTRKEFIRFLYIALGSCSEVKSLLYLSRRLKYCDGELQKSLLEKGDEISRIIRGLIKSMK